MTDMGAAVVPAGPPAVSGRHLRTAAVLLLFFFSGFTSLVYEVVWVRKFGLVFGITTYAVSTVLAAFFAGLAIGSYLAGRLIDRGRAHPLVVYGVMEGAIGVYALVLPALLGLVEATYPAVYGSIGGSFSLFTLFRLVVCLILLAVPTALMGATLPVLSKLMVDRESELGMNVGRLYAVNTFGAVAGTFSAGFLLLPAIGMFRTTLLAAGVNFLLCGAAIAMGRRRAEGGGEAVSGGAEEAAAEGLGPADRIVLVLAFVSGCTILALEVVWTKSLILILGSSTYGFSTMLTAVLLGIAAGSAAFSRFADSSRNRAAAAGILLFTGGLAAALGPAIMNWLPFFFLKLYDWTHQVWALLVVAQLVICFTVVFVPTFLSGASFPMLVRLYSRGSGRVGRTVADVYAVNTLGGILGSLCCGFVLVKFLGLQPSMTAAALTLMVIGGPLGMALASPWSRRTRAGVAIGMIAAVVALGFFHPRFDTKLLFAGWGPYQGGYYASRGTGLTVDVTERYMQRLLYHREGVTSSVDVMEDGYGDLILSINAKPVATSYLYDLRLLRMVGHLPMLLHPDPKEALIVGLGAGVSTGVISIYPGLENVTVVELSEDVPGAAAHFARWNHDVLENEKLNLVLNDGANYVKATRREFDVISADPFHPFVSGAANLYSQEYWQACRERLREGGIMSQYLPLYHLSADDFATVVGTFMDVFPEATLWFCGIDTVLIGCKGQLKIDLNRIGERMLSPTLTSDLIEMGVNEPSDVLGWFVAGPEQLRMISHDARRNRLDLPILEFTSPKAIALGGVFATMPTVLGLVERMSPDEVRQKLNELSARPLDEVTFARVENARLAGRWLMRQQLLASHSIYDQALDAVARAHARRPRDRFLNQALAEAQWSMGQVRQYDGYPEEAYSYFSLAQGNDPESVGALTSAVDAALQMGDQKLAESTLAGATPEQSRCFSTKLYSGWLALNRGDYEEARGAFNEAGRRDEKGFTQESPTMHIGLGVIALHDGDYETGRKHLDRALEIATARADVLADILEACASHDVAGAAAPYAEQLVKAATREIARDPGRPMHYRYRAYAYSFLGEEVKAERDRTTVSSLTEWWQEPEEGWAPPPA